MARGKHLKSAMHFRSPHPRSFGATAVLLATRAMLPLGALLAASALLSL